MTETTIMLTTITQAQDADPIRRVLDGETFMDFHVRVWPIGGMFQVAVSTTREETTEAELTAMVLEVLAQRLVLG